MFRTIAALALASAAALPTSTIASAPAHPAAASAAALNSNSPWWERVTVTMSDDGQAKSCRYETSLSPQGAHDCSVVGGEATMAKTSSGAGAKDEVTRITFERRFSPDANPQLTTLGEGEVLLGGRTLALSIDGAGAVKGCREISTSGSVAPQYGCDQAAAEHFKPAAGAAHSRAAPHTGFLSVLVYGHSEHVV